MVRVGMARRVAGLLERGLRGGWVLLVFVGVMACASPALAGGAGVGAGAGAGAGADAAVGAGAGADAGVVLPGVGERTVSEPGWEGGVLTVEGSGSRTVWVVESPEIRAGDYVVLGEVRASGFDAGVEEAAVVTMWSVFGEERFFSRTFGDRGLMRRVEGDGEWRAFALPFLPSEGMTPDRLEVVVEVKGEGSVSLRGVRLVEGGAGEVLSGVIGWNWGWLGIVVGVMLGLVGGGLGLVSSSGRHRGAAMALAEGGVALSALSFVGGVLVYLLDGSAGGWLLLMILGVGGLFAFFMARSQVSRRYAEREEIRVRAMEAGA